MIKAILKFPFYLIWYAILLPILRVLSLPFLIAAWLIMSAILGIGWVWEKARYGSPPQNIGCD
jgi:hypothetical protein